MTGALNLERTPVACARGFQQALAAKLFEFGVLGCKQALSGRRLCRAMRSCANTYVPRRNESEFRSDLDGVRFLVAHLTSNNFRFERDPGTTVAPSGRFMLRPQHALCCNGNMEAIMNGSLEAI